MVLKVFLVLIPILRIQNTNKINNHIADMTKSKGVRLFRVQWAFILSRVRPEYGLALKRHCRHLTKMRRD